LLPFVLLLLLLTITGGHHRLLAVAEEGGHVVVVFVGNLYSVFFLYGEEPIGCGGTQKTLLRALHVPF